MITKDMFKKITIITMIISLFLAFSFLVGFTNSMSETPLRSNDENTLLDDGEENGNGDEDNPGKGLSIEDLINLVQEATLKHMAILQGVFEYAPKSAWKGIDRAMEVSTRGHIRAIEALSKIKSSNKDTKDNGQKTFHIISSCNRGGTIDPKGIQFIEGENFTFHFEADDGYTLAWVRVDNEKLDGISSHEFEDIGSNHTIHAHFKKIKNSSDQNDDAD